MKSITKAALCMFALLILTTTPLYAARSPGEKAANRSQPDIEFTVQPGSLAGLLRGESSALLPAEIDLASGQTIVIYNQDQALHYILDEPIWPGESLRRSFDQPGVYRFGGTFTCSSGEVMRVTVHVHAAANTSDSAQR